MNERVPILIFVVAILVAPFYMEAQIVERTRPNGWENLVYGGRFMDRFQPMPELGQMTSDTWGASGVVPRDTLNGIEDKKWSYWGGNIRKMEDGYYHLFVCRWAEDSEKGHMAWPNSEVVHAVSENASGPYRVRAEIGKGHNPEWYITKNGKYVIYVIDGYYVSDAINGPWTYAQFDFDTRDRPIIEGLSNLTFAQREDGSFVMICRGGGVWISKDGLSTWYQVSNSSVYPPVDGRFEDPVIWKTQVQYHLIVNDWLGRIAWYLRSKDGLHWKVDPGEAYMPGVAKHQDGTMEDWFKYERLKVMQDSHKRAIQANFAVIDTIKWNDLPNDNHSSKLITIPLTKGKLISITNKKPITPETKKITLYIRAENDFDPITDINFESLRFGAPEWVDFGKGFKFEKVEKKGNDALVTFTGDNNGITEENFTAKLLGEDTAGNLLFGYTRLPETNYLEPALSARKPILNSSGKRFDVVVENFGQVASLESTVSIFAIDGTHHRILGKGKVPPIKPYERRTIQIETESKFSNSEEQRYVVKLGEDPKKNVLFHSATKRSED
ncbi:glycoside hydrolase family protein [Pareuzebyella sediminis]|uniref:glycoside hydrolase family protein n=1 Tax=Pareuzebyella sediminis TaxID=2607998 RepID=UPI0018E13DED|nr:glycoside hydrolase family protein [Pareuzebyella sediminis]